MNTIINKLNNRIKERKSFGSGGSYTAKLFNRGENVIIKKFGEEFTELVMAASKNDKENFICESADVIYHFLVLLNYLEIDLGDIYSELQFRYETR
jgi:phosphoribosyl-ATP pyrophosphohydrolase